MALDPAVVQDPRFQQLSPEEQQQLLSEVHQGLQVQPEKPTEEPAAGPSEAQVIQTPTPLERVGRGLSALPGKLAERGRAAGEAIGQRSFLGQLASGPQVAFQGLQALGDISSALIGTPVSAGLEALGAPPEIAGLGGFGAEVAVPLPGAPARQALSAAQRGIYKLPKLIERVLPARQANKFFGTQVSEILERYVPFERLPHQEILGERLMTASNEAFQAARKVKNDMYDYAASLAPTDIKFEFPQVQEAAKSIMENISEHLGVGAAKAKGVAGEILKRAKPAGEEAIETSIGLVDQFGNVIGPNVAELATEGKQFTFQEIANHIKGVQEAMRLTRSPTDRLLLSNLNEHLHASMREMATSNPQIGQAADALAAANAHFRTTFNPLFGMKSEFQKMSVGDARQIVQKLYGQSKKPSAAFENVHTMLGGNLQAQGELSAGMFREMLEKGSKPGEPLNWRTAAVEWDSLSPKVQSLMVGSQNIDRVRTIFDRILKQTARQPLGKIPGGMTAPGAGVLAWGLTGSTPLGLGASAMIYGARAFSRMLSNPHHVKLLERATDPKLSTADRTRLFWMINQTMHDLAAED